MPLFDIKPKTQDFGIMTDSQFSQLKQQSAGFSQETEDVGFATDKQFAQLKGKVQQPFQKLGRFSQEQFANMSSSFGRTIDIRNTPEPVVAVTPKRMPIAKPNVQNTIGGYNMAGYATAQNAFSLMRDIYDKMENVVTPESAQQEIDRVMRVKNQAAPPRSPITGTMIINSAKKYGIDPKILMTLLRKESELGTKMLTKNNPGNILNTDEGGRQSYSTIEEGIDAAARELARRKITQ